MEYLPVQFDMALVWTFVRLKKTYLENNKAAVVRRVFCEMAMRSQRWGEEMESMGEEEERRK